MKSIEQIAKKINQKIKKWAQQDSKLIIAIDGYAGSGKTSVTNRIAELNSSCLIIHLDDFIKPWQVRKQMLDTARDQSKVFEYKWYRYNTVERLVKRFLSVNTGHIRLKVYDFGKNKFIASRVFNLSKNILIIEGIFLLHPLHKRNTFWQKRIFLNTDLKKADNRKIAEIRQKFGAKWSPKDHPDSYLSYFHEVYIQYLNHYHPEQKADLIINVDAE